MATTDLAPRKAEKKRVKLKMAVQGPSGSGKTWGALALAKNLWPEAKVCLIDTENESASLYADSFDFDTIPLAPPFGTDRYVACIDAAVKGGYDVLIIDTITAQWDGEGGILRRKEAMERANPTANGYALWAKFTPEHEAFKQVILQSPLHVICTMRSKQEYALQQDDRGKMKPVKLGMAPIQRDQMDYEFTIVFDVSMTHVGTASKDRTGLFNDKQVDLAHPDTANAIRGWLEAGKEPPVSAKQAKAEPIPFPKPEEPVFFQFLEPNILNCIIERVEPKTSNKRAWIDVHFNGVHHGCSIATCFDTKLFPLIHASLKKRVQFLIREKDKDGKHYINIEEVPFVEGLPYASGEAIIRREENPDAEPVLDRSVFDNA